MNTILLNTYDTIDAIGAPLAYSVVIVMAIVWIWVMVKYLDTSDLND